jgi:spermidine/putrescine transport system permease protein
MSDAPASRGALTLLRVFYGLLVVFLYAPIVILAVFSFNDGDPSFPLQGFTTQWYGKFFSNPLLLAALRRSLIVAIASSCIAVALGVMAAFALIRRRFVGKPAASALFFSPLVIPYLVFGISLLLLFTLVDKILRQTAGVYIGLGLHAVVIGHVVVTLPYVILVILPLLERLNVSLEEAAHDLGADTWQTFRRVTLPLLAPALFSAFLIAFTLSFDEFAIASFVAGREPTWPVYLFSQLRVPSQLPELIAVSSVILFMSLAVVVLAEMIRRLVERRYGEEYAARGLA